MVWKPDLVMVPVSDVDRAKAFYADGARFNADHDHQINADLRFVQLTPPGSAYSIAIETELTDQSPDSAEDLLPVVSEIQQAHKELSDEASR